MRNAALITNWNKLSIKITKTKMEVYFIIMFLI